MNSASTPPTTKKNMAAAPYMIPIFLWSTVNSQLRQPVSLVGRWKMPSDCRCVTTAAGASSRGPVGCGRSMMAMSGSLFPRLLAGGQVGDQLLDLLLGEV